MVQSKISRDSSYFHEYDDDEKPTTVKPAGGSRPKTKRENEQDMEKFKSICEMLDLSHDNNDEVRQFRYFLIMA